MEINEYQVKRRETDKYLPSESLPCHALGLSSEAGEAAGKVDKHIRKFHNNELSDDERKHIALELGDVLWYAAGLADDIGYSLGEILQMNIDKLASRDKRDQICSIEGGDDR